MLMQAVKGLNKAYGAFYIQTMDGSIKWWLIVEF